MLQGDERPALVGADCSWSLHDVRMVEPSDHLRLDQEAVQLDRPGVAACQAHRTILRATMRLSWSCRAL